MWNGDFPPLLYHVQQLMGFKCHPSRLGPIVITNFIFKVYIYKKKKQSENEEIIHLRLVHRNTNERRGPRQQPQAGISTCRT